MFPAPNHHLRMKSDVLLASKVEAKSVARSVALTAEAYDRQGATTKCQSANSSPHEPRVTSPANTLSTQTKLSNVKTFQFVAPVPPLETRGSGSQSHKMSIAQPPSCTSPSDPNAWSLGPRQSQSLQERLSNRRKRLEAKIHRKRKEQEPYTPFFVPDRLLEDEHRKSGQSQSLLLNRLPTELLLLIVEHLSIPYFQVCFALTCKHVATMLSQNRVRISPWRGWWDKEGLYRLLTQPERPLSSGTSPSRQRQLSLQGLSITDTQPSSHSSRPLNSSQPQPYIPTAYRLCRACFRHVPRDPIYWQSKMRSKKYDTPSVNWFDITNFFEEGYRNCGQHKCPDCCVNGYIAFMNKEAFEKALREDTRDEGWGIDLDQEDKARRVCPSLAERLGRP